LNKIIIASLQQSYLFIFYERKLATMMILRKSHKY